MPLYIGIDSSLSSPAITVLNNSTPHFFYKIPPKQMANPADNIMLFRGAIFHSDPENPTKRATGLQRAAEIAAWCLQIISTISIYGQGEKPEAIAIESISYGSPGRIIQLAELVGSIKTTLYNNGYQNIFDVAPTSLKKFATGSGRAEKSQMREAFETATCIEIKEVLPLCEQDGNPISDIVDSFWLAKYAEINKNEILNKEIKNDDKKKRRRKKNRNS